MTFIWMIHTCFANMWLIFQEVSIIFNTLLPTLSKMLYTNVVKLPTSTSEHFMKTFFQFVVIWKITST
jgi:predicted membrane-bound mannosyltransferase